MNNEVVQQLRGSISSGWSLSFSFCLIFGFYVDSFVKVWFALTLGELVVRERMVKLIHFTLFNFRCIYLHECREMLKT